MTLINPARRREWHSRSTRAGDAGPVAVFAGMTALGAVAWLYVAGAFPVDAMLPVIGAFFLVLAAVAAAIAWSCPKPAASVLTYWDVAGALTLIAVCIAAAVEPDQMVRLVAADRQP